MSYLVTGASGFVGVNLVRALSKKDRVIAFVRKSSDTRFIKNLKDVRIVYGDILDKASIKEACKDVEVVYHAAGALGGFGIGYSHLRKINYEGTKNVAEAAIDKRLIHISSVAAMGPAPDNADESFAPNPVSAYDRAKHESEQAIKALEEENGLRSTILRPTMIYGPYELRNKRRMFELIARGRFFIIGNGKNLMSMLYIRNFVDASVLATRKSAIHQLYIISDGRPCTMNELVYTIADQLKVRRPIHVPKPFAYSAASLMWAAAKLIKFDPPLTFSRINNLTSSHVFSIDKAKKELGYAPRISLKEGVSNTISWYRDNNYL